MPSDKAANMNPLYVMMVDKILNSPDKTSVTRKGEPIRERMYYEFTLLDPWACLTTIRPAFSMEYLKKEIDFYCSGSDKLEDAVKLSKFWKKCSDDGKTVNSNYGKILLHDRNAKGLTQFEYVMEALQNNPDSKKAVMSVYSPEHAFISNDNPCTMFLHFCIVDNKLHVKTHMRSNDVWFGVVYDVPFFCAVQYAVCEALKCTYPNLTMGTYTHYACSIHIYERNVSAVLGMLSAARGEEDNSYALYRHYKPLVQELFEKVHKTAIDPEGYEKEEEAPMSFGMHQAWEAAKKSNCLKKKCGAALVFHRAYSEPFLLSAGYGGKEGKKCVECSRDSGEKFYGDGCWSVHAEMRVIMGTLKAYAGLQFEEATMYVTHGPCDACMKLMDYVGIRKVVYDIPYKTDYSHWPRITVVREAVTPESVEKGKSAEDNTPKCFGRYTTHPDALCHNCRVDVLCSAQSKRMSEKKPECYGGFRSAQHDAESGCVNCKFNAACCFTTARTRKS